MIGVIVDPYNLVKPSLTLGDVMEAFDEAQDNCSFVNTLWTVACVLAGTDTMALSDFEDFCHERLDRAPTPRDVLMWAIMWDTGTDWRD